MSRSSARIQPATIADDRGEEEQVAGEPHDPAGQLLVVERRSGPTAGRASRSAGRAATAAFRMHDREERVLGHLEEDVQAPGPGAASATAPGRARRPATRTAAPPPRNSTCSRSWTSRVLERRVEQRREVGPPHDAGEERARRRPGWRDARSDAASGGPAGSSAGGRRGEATRRSSVIGAARAMSGAATSDQQDVLDHVDREQRRVVALDPGQQRERDRGQPAEERDGPARAARGRRVGGVRPAGPPHDPARPPSRRAAAVEQRLERPAEERGWRRSAARPGPGRGRATGAGPAAPADRDASATAATGRDRRRRATRRSAALARGPSSRPIVARSPGMRAASARRRAGAAPGIMGAVRTGGSDRGRSAEPSRPQPRRPPRVPAASLEIEDRPCRARPGARPSSGTIIAGLVAVVVLVGLGVTWSSLNGPADRPELLPAGSGRRPRAREIRDLYTIVFIIAAIDLLRRRGADRLDGHPLPAQAGRRRAAAADPRQQPRRGRLDGRPDAHRHLPVRHLVADAQHASRPRLAAARPQGPGRRRPVPVEVRLPRRATARPPTTAGLHGVDADRAGWRPRAAGRRTIHLYLTSPDVIHAFYVPQFLFKRDVVPGRVNQFDFTVDAERRRPDLPRPVRRAVRHRPPDHAVRRASR